MLDVGVILDCTVAGNNGVIRNSLNYVRWTLCGISASGYTDNAPSFWHRLQEVKDEKAGRKNP